MRLVEPVGVAIDADAVAAGLALKLAGGPACFPLARLHEPGQAPSLVRATDIPPRFSPALDRLTAAPGDGGLPAGSLLMGILNATPDSFSDGGRNLDPATAIAAGARMIGEGAGIIDIGGESTRPGAVPPTVADEIARVRPVFAGLADAARAAGVMLSADTRRAAVMAAALDAGATMINDVSALAFDPEARAMLAARNCPVVLMHMRGTPETMRSHAQYDDVAVEVVRALAARIDEAVAAGIDRARILVDPGIGFAKTAAHNLALLRRLPILANLGCRIVLGVSRKSFIRRLDAAPDDADPESFLPGSVVAAEAARFLPGTVLRVHDVAAARQARRVGAAIA